MYIFTILFRDCVFFLFVLVKLFCKPIIELFENDLEQKIKKQEEYKSREIHRRRKIEKKKCSHVL